MTRFSPPIIYQCPACAGYFKRCALISLHYYDDVPEWSDGKNGQWWAGSSGQVGRCPACSKTVWIEDATEVMPSYSKPAEIGVVARWWHRITGDRSGRLREECEWNALPNGVKGAERIYPLQDAQDFVEALAALPPDAPAREAHLRQRLWWLSGDHQRLGTDGTSIAPQPTVASATASENKKRLLELIEHDPKAQVARGELLRQLERFDEAVATLKAVKPDGYSEVKAVKIERLALARNADLQAI
ncbi:hypothetical protein [Rugamonas aquatica]|uniref:Uncharacterized protein n=1 Tax=Rugamonas aquatica TaxID=2743357 RepID=A0A6A7N0T8_9BURK|nr:hypothetical protein [Rugamonas aquatica]MQA38637.1 hypothetical protein [Rugamonas aquatica]